MMHKSVSFGVVNDALPAPLNGSSAAWRESLDAGSRIGSEACTSEYIVEISTDRINDAAFCSLWRDLVAASDSPQKIYQSPEFFRFLLSLAEAGKRHEILVVFSRSTGAIVGIVPVQVAQQALNFKVGKWSLFRVQVEVVSILGSIPTGPVDSALIEELAWRMLALFPEAKAIYMQALPRSSEYWKNLSESIASGRGLAQALIGPWQECHTLFLPPTFDQYLKSFSAKKRYNLNRQIRQLGEQAGQLTLCRIDRPDQVAAMMGTLKRLLSQAEMAVLLHEKTYAQLAGEGLLLCYILMGNDTVLAAVVGTRSRDVMHVHNIFTGEDWHSLSVGTSIMHLVVEDLAGLGCFQRIDFGYGTPNHQFRSSHVLETRAKVLVFDRMRSVSLLFFIHTVFDRLSESLALLVKASLRLWLSAWRKA